MSYPVESLARLKPSIRGFSNQVESHSVESSVR